MCNVEHDGCGSIMSKHIHGPQDHTISHHTTQDRTGWDKNAGTGQVDEQRQERARKGQERKGKETAKQAGLINQGSMPNNQHRRTGALNRVGKYGNFLGKRGRNRDRRVGTHVVIIKKEGAEWNLGRTDVQYTSERGADAESGVLDCTTGNRVATSTDVYNEGCTSTRLLVEESAERAEQSMAWHGIYGSDTASFKEPTQHNLIQSIQYNYSPIHKCTKLVRIVIMM